MIRLRSLTVSAALLAIAAFGLSGSPAFAADQPAACDPALATGLRWSAPSALAWGREARIGANVLDALDGPAYQEGSVAVGVDAGNVRAAPDPIAHDLEFIVGAPSSGTAIAANATWLLTDDAGATHCAQSAALSIPTDSGTILRYSAARGSDGITWTPIGAGNCHDVATQAVTLTLRQSGVTRHLTAPDQCVPKSTAKVGTPDWQLSTAGGAFHLTALRARSSLHARMRYTVRVGSRRVASGSLALVRNYRPDRLIKLHDPDFYPICVHSLLPHKAANDPTMLA
jgi:hypothetical protein